MIELRIIRLCQLAAYLQLCLPFCITHHTRYSIHGEIIQKNPVGISSTFKSVVDNGDVRRSISYTNHPHQSTLSRAIRSTTNLSSGQGWGNDDFLNSLGKDDEERQNEKENYEEFKQSREAFEERQKERMATEAGQKFMQAQREAEERQRKMMMERNKDLDSDGGFFDDQFGMIDDDMDDMDDLSREGSRRFASMMRQANQRKQGNNVSGMIGPEGFEQKFAIPLDDEEQEDEPKQS